MSEKFGVELDFETADRILVCALKEHYEYVMTEARDFMQQSKAAEASENLLLASHMVEVLKYFGEQV